MVLKTFENNQQCCARKWFVNLLKKLKNCCQDIGKNDIRTVAMELELDFYDNVVDFNKTQVGKSQPKPGSRKNMGVKFTFLT